MTLTVVISAGKNASIASSARVISTGLSNTVVVLKNASGPCTVANRSGTAKVSKSRGFVRLTVPAGIG
jgi:ribosomal protein S11